MSNSSDDLLLGGRASPIGWWITYVQTPLTDLEQWLQEHWFGERPFVAQDADPYPASLTQLEPLESPWTKHLLHDVGGWTVHLSNSLLGGDPSAPGPVLNRRFGYRVVVAGHSPRHGPGHETTALWVFDEQGSGARAVQAHCADGRWTWHERGEPLRFEDTSRYAARGVRDRLDRPLLLQYLKDYGLFPDDRKSFGKGRLFSGAPTGGRSVTSVDRRRELEID